MLRVVRRFALFCLLCLFSLLPIAAEAFQGRLVDRQTGRPIAGADIGIAGLAGIVRTNADGGFVWAPDPPLPFDVLIMLPGGRFAKPVRIVSLGEAPTVIHVDPAVVETLTVSGSAPGVDAAPGSAATLVSSTDIQRRAPANLMQALEAVTGVSGLAEGQTAVPAIRGLARGRTLLLLDGSRMFSERRAGPSVSFLSPESLDRIDVVRGPASVAYGSDAFGGVISMVTRQPAIAAPFEARLAATYGAGVPAGRVEGHVATGISDRGGVIVQARRRRAEDYSSPVGVVSNSAWHDDGALVRAGLRAGGWWTAAWQGDSLTNSGLPRSDSDTVRVSIPYERSKRVSASFNRAVVPVIGHLTVTGLWGRYEQRLDQDRLPAPGRPRRIDRADIDGTDAELRAIARTGLRSARLTAGADVLDRHDLHAHDFAIVFNAAGAITSTTDNASIVSARRRDVGAFAQVDVPLGTRMTTAFGARFDHVNSVNEGGFFGDRTVSHSAPSGSAAIAVRVSSSLVLTSQASSGFRDPTLSDRFFRGPVGRGFIVGNPDLEPERSLQFDVAARYDRGRWHASARYFHYDIDDLIERYQAGAELFLFRNRGLAEIRGVEIEGGVAAARGVSFDFSAQHGRGRARDNGAPLDDIAPARAILQVRQALGARIFVTGRITGVADDTVPGPTEVSTPGYVDVAATAGWQTGRYLELRLAAANLLNQRYYSSTSSRGVLAPGRYVTVTAVVKY